MRKFKYIGRVCAMWGWLICVISCGGGSEGRVTDDNSEDDAPAGAIQQQDAVRPAEVTTLTMATGIFNHEIISNGTLKATESVDVYPRSQEIVTDIQVHNGQQVTKGQVLARLDDSRLRNTLQQNITSVEQAQLQMKDILIGQGYDPDDTTRISKEVMKLARTKSGIDGANAALANTRMELDATVLKAPISGVVANLDIRRLNQASSSEPLCRLIGNNSMEVEFPVMESELPLVAPGEKILVANFSNNKDYPGTVTAVNPMVEKNGMVRVWARIDKTPQEFVDGMNVRVRLRKAVPDQIVVPKSAVVVRSDRQVVFTYDGEGRAIWNYVTVGLENLEEYTILEGLEPGMEVITSGNINLAHESPVTVMPKN